MRCIVVFVHEHIIYFFTAKRRMLNQEELRESYSYNSYPNIWH